MTIQYPLPVPHLTTALSGPLEQIEKHLLDHQGEIEAWFRCQWKRTPAPFYASVDLRNSGFKLAPVDTNLFPAGFNNLNPAFMPLCIQAIQSAMEHICPDANGVLIVPERHTRNTFYLESLAVLHDIIVKSGFSARIGWMDEEMDTAQVIDLPSGRQVRLEPIVRSGDRVGLADFDPCMVLLNNDLSDGVPAILEGIEQSIIPPLAAGWSHRLKSSHFEYYRLVAEEFAAMTDLDPWLISPLNLQCGEIDFMKREGEDCLARNVENLIGVIQRKYDEYGLDKAPFVVIKADAGTYGMGVMTVHSAEEIAQLNRKQRTRMAASKGGAATSQVLLQEGVYTFETWGQARAVTEPVVYMIDHHVIGGFYRVHTRRGSNENLNAPGMHFEPLAFADHLTVPERHLAPDAQPNRFYAYGVIARLALVAAARELESLA